MDLHSVSVQRLASIGSFPSHRTEEHEFPVREVEDVHHVDDHVHFQHEQHRMDVG